MAILAAAKTGDDNVVAVKRRSISLRNLTSRLSFSRKVLKKPEIVHMPFRKFTNRVTPFEVLQSRGNRNRAPAEGSTLSLNKKTVKTELEHLQLQNSIESLLPFIPNSIIGLIFRQTAVVDGDIHRKALLDPVEYTGVIQVIDIKGYSTTSNKYAKLENKLKNKAARMSVKMNAKRESIGQVGFNDFHTASQSSIRGTGGEKLFGEVNKLFTLLVPTIAEFNGDIIKFAGDAIIVAYNWDASFQATDKADDTSTVVDKFKIEVLRAAMCSLQLTKIVARSQDSHSAIHIALSCGTVKSFCVGGIRNRWEHIIAGKPLEQMSDLVSQASNNECVITPEIYAMLLDSQVTVTGQMLSNGNYLIHSCIADDTLKAKVYQDVQARSTLARLTAVANMLKTPAGRISSKSFLSLVGNVAIKFVPLCLRDDVRYRSLNGRKSNIQQGQSQILKATVVFVNIFGVDYVNDKNAPRKLQMICSTLQSAIYENDGFLRQICVDDKGTILIGVFQSPIFGITAALQMSTRVNNENMKMNANTKNENHAMIAIGIATGISLCTMVGNTFRGEYAIVGDVPVMAARLMSYGSKQISKLRSEYSTLLRLGSVLSYKFPTTCDQLTMESVQDKVRCAKLCTVVLKGNLEPVQLYTPEKSSINIISNSDQVFVGRDEEMKQLQSTMRQFFQRNRKTLGNTGDRPNSRDDMSKLKTFTRSLSENAVGCNAVNVYGALGQGKSSLLHRALGSSIAQENTTISVHGRPRYLDEKYGVFRDVFHQMLLQMNAIKKKQGPQHQRRNSNVLSREGSSLKVNSFLELIEDAHKIALSVKPEDSEENTIPEKQCQHLAIQSTDSDHDILLKSQAAQVLLQLKEADNVQKWIPVLRQLLPHRLVNELSHNAENSDDKNTDNDSYIEALAIAVVGKFIEKFAPRGMILSIDNAQYCDVYSWRVLSKLVRSSMPILTFFVTPHYNKFVNPMSGTLYEEILGSMSCEKILVGPLSIDHIQKLAKKQIRLDTESIDRDVWRRIHEQSNGNPFIATEYIRHMLRKKVLIEDESGGYRHDFEKENVMGIPDAVEDMISKSLDLLEPQELIVLKCCSILGRRSEFQIVETIFPYSPEEFASTVEILVHQGWLLSSSVALSLDDKLTEEVSENSMRRKSNPYITPSASFKKRKASSVQKVTPRERFERCVYRVMKNETSSKSIREICNIKPSATTNKGKPVMPTLSFALDLVKQLVYNRIPHSTRRQYHQSVAEAISEKYKKQIHLVCGTLAYHWGIAEDHTMELKYLQMLASHFLRSANSAEAINVLQYLVSLGKPEVVEPGISTRSVDHLNEFTIHSNERAEFHLQLATAACDVNDFATCHVNIAQALAAVGLPDELSVSAINIHQVEVLLRTFTVSLTKWCSKFMFATPSAASRQKKKTLQQFHCELQAQAHQKMGELFHKKRMLALKKDKFDKHLFSAAWKEISWYTEAANICLRAPCLSEYLGDSYILIGWALHTRGWTKLVDTLYSTAVRIIECLYAPVKLFQFLLIRSVRQLLIGSWKYSDESFDRLEAAHKCLNDATMQACIKGHKIDYYMLRGEIKSVRHEAISVLEGKVELKSIDFFHVLRIARIASLLGRNYDAILLVNRVIQFLTDQFRECSDHEHLISWNEYPKVVLQPSFMCMEITQLEDWRDVNWGGRHVRGFMDLLVCSTSALVCMRLGNVQRCSNDLRLAFLLLSHNGPEIYTAMSFVSILQNLAEAIILLLQANGGIPIRWIRSLCIRFEATFQIAPICKPLGFVVEALLRHSECMLQNETPTRRVHQKCVSLCEEAEQLAIEGGLHYAAYVVGLASTYFCKESGARAEKEVDTKKILQDMLDRGTAFTATHRMSDIVQLLKMQESA